MSDDVEQIEALPPLGFIAYNTDEEGRPQHGIFYFNPDRVETHYKHKWVPVVTADTVSATYTMLGVLLAHIHGEDADRIRHVGLQASYDRAVQKVRAWRAADPNPIKLRELMFSDGFVHRWNDGQLEYLLKNSTGEWWPCPEIRMDDFDKVLDLRANPYETLP